MESNCVWCSYSPAQNPLAIVTSILDVHFCELEMWTGKFCRASSQILIYWFQYCIYMLSTQIRVVIYNSKPTGHLDCAQPAAGFWEHRPRSSHQMSILGASVVEIQHCKYIVVVVTDQTEIY